MNDRKTQSLQRVLEIAAQMFSRRPFETVSVTEIAEAAHCSTATIYDVYLSKENLFLEAMSHVLDTRSGPRLARVDVQPSLETLLTYVEARARYLANAEQRSVSRALCAQLDMMKPLVSSVMNREDTYVEAALLAEVRADVDAGLLRPLEPDVIVYIIRAVTTYEPVVFGLLYGDDTPVAFDALLRKLFAPLVSAKGRRQVEAYLARTDRVQAVAPGG